MSRPQTESIYPEEAGVAAGVHSSFQMRSPHLNCLHCGYTLECVEQNRRSGTWLGSLICPNCRSEYFYAYRWGRLTRKG
jgi:Zn finger protein HypA/HybF involved in hydrogenase expression